MKSKVSISPLRHRGEDRIRIDFTYDRNIISQVKQVPGAKWSRTHGCWHVPYTGEAYRKLKEMFEVVVAQGSGVLKVGEKSREKEDRKPEPKEVVRCEEEGKGRMKVYVPYWRKDWIDEVRRIAGRAWNSEGKYWSVPLVKETVERLRAYFGEAVVFGFDSSQIPEEGEKPGPDTGSPMSRAFHEWMAATGNVVPGEPLPGKENACFPEPSFRRQSAVPPGSIRPNIITTGGTSGEVKKIVTGNRIIADRWDGRWLGVYVPADKKGWLEAVRGIAGRRWKSEEKCWLVPITKETLAALDGFGEKYIVKNYQIEGPVPEKWIAEPTDRQEEQRPLNEMQQRAVTALEERLHLEFKSHRTIKSYRGHLISLMRHFPEEKPSNISEEQIRKYIVYKKKEKGIKASTMNQMISAFNAFFGRVLEQEEKVVQLVRPKKDRQLPNYASEEDITKLIKSLDNIKHKCMLILIYSAGLRKGEVLNLRVRDLNASAKTLFVKGGKGRKDRYTLYSPKAIEYIREYMKIYKPRYWLFEGQTGGRYSETSLQTIFEKAKEKSGINPQLTIHGIRHSFATHMVYKGVPLHEIKQLLGHESLKTTEIYLHLANRYNREIRSPLEDLDL